MSFFAGLSLLLAAAKLFGFAHYSWLVVFLPVGGELALAAIIAGLLVLKESL